MSQDDLTPDTAAPAGAPKDLPRTTPAAAPRRSGGTLALALLLALLALVGAGYVGWRQWQQQRSSGANGSAIAGLRQRVDGLERTLSGVSSGGTSLQQRLDEAEQANRSLREQLQGQDERLRSLESAVGKLSQRALSGHDAMLLDDTESLLRMGQQRYELFHDARGAAAAYALAGSALAAVDDPAFANVRQDIDAEHTALLRSAPASDSAVLDTLTQLRGTATGLPLKPLDASAAPDDGAWARIGRALSSVISIHRDNGAPLAVADARFARELLALDLAQAQAALLAGDAGAARAALERADAGLVAQFDPQSDEVKQARVDIAHLLGQVGPGAPVRLGGALEALRNLRSVHALAGQGGAPAPAASAGGATP